MSRKPAALVLDVAIEATEEGVMIRLRSGKPMGFEVAALLADTLATMFPREGERAT